MLLGILIMVLATSSAFAASTEVKGDPVMVKIFDRRGNWIADGILSISNPGNGKIGIYMTTQCHVAVDEIQMDIGIERYNDSTRDWEQVDYFTFNFYPEGGKPLTSATVNTDIPGYGANKTYRLNGWHTVFVNGSNETLHATTSGMLITN